MTDTVEIKGCIGTTDADIPLGVEVWVDQSKVLDLEHVTGSVEFAHHMTDDQASHELRIVLKNKQSEHTKVDAEGNIVSDARITVSDVCFDDIPLNYLFVKNSQYSHDFNGTGPTTQQMFYGEMGCNGTVSLKFTSPVYLWLLENL